MSSSSIKKAEAKAHERWLKVAADTDAASTEVSMFRRAFELLGEVLRSWPSGGEMVRHVAPGVRPEKRHEFEDLSFRSPRGPGSPLL